VNESAVSCILNVTWRSRCRTAHLAYPKSARHSWFYRLLHILRCPSNCSSLSAVLSPRSAQVLSKLPNYVGGFPHRMTFGPNDRLVLWCGQHEVEPTRVYRAHFSRIPYSFCCLCCTVSLFHHSALLQFLFPATRRALLQVLWLRSRRGVACCVLHFASVSSGTITIAKLAMRLNPHIYLHLQIQSYLHLPPYLHL